MTNHWNREKVCCPLCGSRAHKPRIKPWRTVPDPLALYGTTSGIQGTQHLVTCEVCDFIFENPRFPESVILEGYRSCDEQRHDSQYPFRVQSFLRVLTKLSACLPPKGSRVLDIGTASGAFLEAARKFGYRPIGTELSKSLVTRGRARGLDIREGTLDQDFAAESFDLICLWDVLEHVVQPRELLGSIHGLLKPGGTLLINYPDIGTWQAKLTGKRFWWIISVHLHHFTRKTLARMCEKAGFQVTHYRAYWQTIEIGYLQQMAMQYKIPLSGLLHRLTPAFIRRIPISYYASQVTALAGKQQ